MVAIPMMLKELFSIYFYMFLLVAYVNKTGEYDHTKVTLLLLVVYVEISKVYQQTVNNAVSAHNKKNRRMKERLEEELGLTEETAPDRTVSTAVNLCTDHLLVLFSKQ